MKTYSAKPTDVVRKWYVIDAADAPLGRIATHAATLLTGKGKPQFTHHIDCGDYVIIINATNILVTGDRMEKKVYYRHSKYPGGLSSITLGEQVEKDPTVPFFKAIRGMLPVNKLRDARLQRLKIYAGSEHLHDPQQPEIISLKEGKA
jgi:large subunit ribosomal protein L13